MLIDGYKSILSFRSQFSTLPSLGATPCGGLAIRGAHIVGAFFMMWRLIAWMDQ
nr:MAG TPA: hypothetical protein [Caudoviricetes sp.]